MDFQSFIRKVTMIKTEIVILFELEAVGKEYKSMLKGVMIPIIKLSDFLSDLKNVEALEAYYKKSENIKDTCPLDILCKDVLTELIAIDPLLDSSIFDYIPQRNRPTANQVGSCIASHSQSNNASINIGNLYNKLDELFSKSLLSAFEVLKYLSGHNSTLIILGANGSGKTSFANYLKSIETHVKVIPASKPIKAQGHIPSLYTSTIDSYREELFRGGDLEQDLLQKLIVALCTEHDNAARKFYATLKKEDTTFERIKRIFDDFFEVKLDNSDFGNKNMQATKTDVPPFPFNKMSDGERVAFFYIATVIAASPQSFIVVDEPESHLNPAIYNKIWDKLIEERSDCQFILISHTMEFINARSNFELVKIRNFVYPDKFDFEFLGSALDDLNPDFIVEIVGSRKPILFCEGSKTDYDYKIYENLYGTNYTVIPTGNCANVENSVDACNLHASTYSIQSAVGIIDSDLKSDTEIARLSAKQVYVLKCNEIEMLLLDENIFKKVLTQIYKPETEFNAFKAAFFKKLTERKEHLIKRLVKTQIDEKLRVSVIDDKKNKTQQEIKANLSNIFGGIDVDTMWADCDSKITDIITQQNYDAALKYCCLEHTEVIIGVGKPFVTDYATIAMGVLKDDENLSRVIKQKYFGNFN